MSGDLVEDTRLQVVMEEQRQVQQVQIVHEQRIASLETRTTVIEVKQNQLESALTQQATSMSKLADTVAEQVVKTTIHDGAIGAIKDRTDIMAAHMERATDRLTEKQEQGTKKMERLETQMSVVKAIGAALVGAAALVGIEHFFR